jgi:hypothetical protein
LGLIAASATLMDEQDFHGQLLGSKPGMAKIGAGLTPKYFPR